MGHRGEASVAAACGKPSLTPRPFRPLVTWRIGVVKCAMKHDASVGWNLRGGCWRAPRVGLVSALSRWQRVRATLPAAWMMLAAACGETSPDESNQPDPAPESLREAAKAASTLIGTAVDARALADDERYRELIVQEFDYVTAENAMKWEPLAPQADSYDWQDADAIVDFASEHGLEVKGHTLVWHRQYPSWVDSLDEAALARAMQHHIETTMARYRGKVRAWDVVNEAIDASTDSGYTDSVFYRELGLGYIADAFRWARAADPDALLFYNEVGIERMGLKSDLTYQLMVDLLAEGVPVDGIGFQSHVSTHRYPSALDLRENIRRFSALGLIVNISEVDARTVLMPGDRELRWHTQRLAFQQITGACVVEGCESVTFWGFTDRYSWIHDDSPEPDDPLLFDRDYQLKPAYQGVMDGLSGRLPEEGDNQLINGDFADEDASWTATGGALQVSEAEAREGNAACLSQRTAPEDGIMQAELETKLRDGGAFAFAAWVRVLGAGSATVEASLRVREVEQEPELRSLATGPATDSGWTSLRGYFGLGFGSEPSSIELILHGPSADVELCVADVQVRPLAP